jgi:hypothetical protein
LNRSKVKAEHCYSMTPVNGRRTIARVTKLFRITAMAAYEEIGTETFELNPTVVRFVWRHAAYPTGWSTRRQQLLLDEFALTPEKEFTGTQLAASRRHGHARRGGGLGEGLVALTYQRLVNPTLA